MKKVTLLVFLMAMLAFGAISQITDLEKRQMDDFRNPNATTISIEKRNIPQTIEDRIATDNNFVKMHAMSEMAATTNSKFAKSNEELIPSDEIKDCYNWGTVTFVENGKQMDFIQRNEWSHNSGYTPFFKSVTFEFLDEKRDVIKTVNLKLNDTTVIVSMIAAVSKSVFNTDKQFEFMIHVRNFADIEGISGPEACRDTIYVINEDGKILNKFGNTRDATIVYDNQVKPAISKLVLYSAFYSTLHTDVKIEVYNPKKLVKEHTLSIPNNLLTYSEGSTFRYVKIDDIPYFYTAHYEKPFNSGTAANPIIEKNNKYIIQLLNPTTYDITKEFKLNLIGQDENEWSMVSHGLFSSNMKYDISTKIFNTDGGFEILYGMGRYNIDCDCNRIDYYVVDESNNIVKTIITNVNYMQKIADIQGESEQYAALYGQGDQSDAIKFIKMPSGEEVYSFDAVYNGELLSANFERVPAKGGYNYVFGLGRGESANNTMYGGIAYYNIKGELVKRDRVDLGPKAALFTPVIMSSTLSPYWADTDEGNEYPFFAKVYTTGAQIESFFGISDDDSSIMYRWGDDDRGRRYGAGVLADADRQLKELYVSYKQHPAPVDNVNIGTTYIYTLPLKSFTSGGTGTEEDPYIVTNPGELNAIRYKLEAHYALGNDIDLKDYSTLDGKGWLPIGTLQTPFKGSLNGRGYSIKNMFIDRPGTSRTGLFASVVDAVIKNVNMLNVNILNGVNVGAISSSISNDEASIHKSIIENCHVTGSISAETNGGGVVSDATLNSIIKMCSFDGTLKATAGAAGGIVAKATTGTKVYLCHSNGSISGKASVGGIMGTSLTNAIIEDCYSTADITANNFLGGIIGGCSGFVNRTYSKGAIKAEGEKFVWKAGGIVGSLTQKMALTDAKNSVALNPIITANETYGRIIGDKVPNELITSSNNYAIPTMKIGVAGSEATVTSTDATSANGADKALAEMNEAFYKSIDWKFGNDSLNPWKMVDSYPRLWYEFIVRGVSLNETEITIDITKTFQLVADIMPATAEDKGLLWESSDNKIAKVDQKGLITAIGKGTATITVTTDDGDYVATCVVAVNIPVTSITLDQTTVELEKDKQITLKATVNPEDANNTKVLWSTSNAGIATVTPKGEVKGIKVGDVVITAMTEDGGFKATCNVKVVILTNKIVLNETDLNMLVAGTFQLEATVRPTDATNKNVTWTSSNAAIATVSNTGFVTAVAVGTTTITATAIDGGATATCEMEVEPQVSVDNLSTEHINIFHANGQIIIDSSIDIEGVIVHDISGRTIYSGQSLSIPTSSWNNGIYVVRATDANNVIKTSKIVIK